MIGGVVGRPYAAAHTDLFWNTETTGISLAGVGTGKTTAQMKQQATFINWNFSTVWTIDEGNSFPKLRWANP
jgi:hypothetical protein